MRDGDVENIGSESNVALSVRVVHSGAWGFAATRSLDPDGIADRCAAHGIIDHRRCTLRALFRHVEAQIARLEAGNPLQFVVDRSSGY